MKQDNWTKINENAKNNAGMIVNELNKTKSDYSNAAIHAYPQTGKDALAQQLIKCAADSMFDETKPLVCFNVLCDSNVETKTQTITRRLKPDSTVAKLYAQRQDFACFVLHRNDLDALFTPSLSRGKNKKIKDIGYVAEDGTRQTRVEPLGVRELREMLDMSNVIVIFDEFHQHIHQDKAIAKFHEFVGVSPQAVNKNKPVFYITATGAALYTYMHCDNSAKIRSHYMTEPEGYYGLEDYIADNKFIDWDVFKSPLSGDKLAQYDKIFSYIKTSYAQLSAGHVVVRYMTPKNQSSDVFEKMVEDFCKATNSRVRYVDMHDPNSASEFRSSLEATPSGGAFAKFGTGTQKNVYVLKQMFACGQSLAKHNIRWWIEPPMMKNNPTAIQRMTRVCGVGAGNYPIRIIAPLKEAQLYIEAHTKLKTGDYGPMAQLDNQLVKSKAEIDHGWSYLIAGAESVQKLPNKYDHSLSGLASKTTPRRGTIDVTEQCVLALDVGESKTNLINTNLVGGTRNVEYTDPQTQQVYQCFSVLLDGPNPNDYNNYWESHLMQHKGKRLIAFRGRKARKIKSDPKLNKNFMMASYVDPSMVVN